MNVELEASGERRTATVNKSGSVYLGKEYAEKEIEVAFEVIENDE